MSEYIFLPKNQFIEAPQIRPSFDEARTYKYENLTSSKSACSCCLKKSDGKTVINQLTFTIRNEDKFRFETIYLCSDCQGIYYQHLQVLLGRDEGGGYGKKCIEGYDEDKQDALREIIQIQEKTLKLFMRYAKRLSSMMDSDKRNDSQLLFLKDEILECLNTLVELRKDNQNFLSN